MRSSRIPLPFSHRPFPPDPQVEFGDFSFYRMDEIIAIRLVRRLRASQTPTTPPKHAQCPTCPPLRPLAKHRSNSSLEPSPPPTVLRQVGGFARAGTVPSHLYEKAVPDPVAGSATPVISKWNAAVPEAPVRWVKHYVGDVGVEKAVIASLDRLGLNLMARPGGGLRGVPGRAAGVGLLASVRIVWVEVSCCSELAPDVRSF